MPVFTKKQIPDDIQVVPRPAGTIALLDLFMELSLIKSKSEGSTSDSAECGKS